MMNIVKQVAGIDVAQNELVVSLGRLSHSMDQEVYAFKTFANKPSGFAALLTWIKKHTDNQVAVSYVMEATGVYHEKLAYSLTDQNRQVCIVLPNKISNYIRTLEMKTITDKTASQAICRFGLERKLELWKQPDKQFKNLEQLTRERDQLIGERTVAKNQLHAELARAFPHEGTVSRLKQRIDLFNRQGKEIETDIAVMVKQNKELHRKTALLTSIPGVGKLTAIIVLAETNGFDLIRNKKQLVSYSGLDVKVKESGTSVRSKPRISKKGNRHLRKAMYMPALAAIRSEGPFKTLYNRLVSRHGIRMKAAVAVQRKILELIYIIWKTDSVYNPGYTHQSLKEQAV